MKKVGRKKIDPLLKARAIGYTFTPAQIAFIKESGGSRFMQKLVNEQISIQQAEVREIEIVKALTTQTRSNLEMIIKKLLKEHDK